MGPLQAVPLGPLQVDIAKEARTKILAAVAEAKQSLYSALAQA